MLLVGYDPKIFSSVQFSLSVVSDSLRPHEPQHARPPYPSPIARFYPNWCPLCRWCHPTISSSVIPFSSCPQFFPASGSFQMSQLFASGSQSTRVSASTSVLPMNIQDWFPLGLEWKYHALERGIKAPSVQSLHCVRLFEIPRTAAGQISLSITNSQSPPKPMSIKSVMPSNHLILCCSLLLLPSIFPSIRVFSNESALRIR